MRSNNIIFKYQVATSKTVQYVMFRRTIHTKSIMEPSARRLLSSQQAVKVTKSSSSATASFSRLDALRQRLANEDNLSIDNFAGGQPKSVVVRRKAAPRSAKILPKPKWLRVQPADSDNYRRLRKTVRESGLATVW